MTWHACRRRSRQPPTMLKKYHTTFPNLVSVITCIVIPNTMNTIFASSSWRQPYAIRSDDHSHDQQGGNKRVSLCAHNLHGGAIPSPSQEAGGVCVHRVCENHLHDSSSNWIYSEQLYLIFILFLLHRLTLKIQV